MDADLREALDRMAKLVWAKADAQWRAILDDTVAKEREKVKQEQGEWQEQWKTFKTFMNRLQVDDRTRKAWMVIGDYQLLQEYVRAVEKKSQWKIPNKDRGHQDNG